jgi:hypothetical protein
MLCLVFSLARRRAFVDSGVWYQLESPKTKRSEEADFERFEGTQDQRDGGLKEEGGVGPDGLC